MKRNLLVLAVMVVGMLFFTPHNAGAQCPEDPNDLGECDTLYVEVFDCDHQYQAGADSFDSVRVAIYVTHDSNTFWWETEDMWVQDSIAGFVIPLTFWDNGCADSVILPDWDNWNNIECDPASPYMSRSIFGDIVDTHTGDTVYNRMYALAKENPYLAWSTIILNIESHASDGDSGHMYLSMIPSGPSNRRWWEGSRVLLATLTFLIHGLDEDCDSTQICIDSTFWPPTAHLTFTRNDAAMYFPRHFLPYCSSIHYLPSPEVQATSPAQNELNVPVSTNISVTFDTTMDETTINDSTFIVNARSTGLHQGTISYDSLTRTATFDPISDFDVGEVVTMVLTSGIESSEGIPMINGYAWSFTTAVDHGASTFAPQTLYATGDGPQSVFAADLDGDGHLDLAASNLNSDNISILLNNGNGTFGDDSLCPVGDGPHTIIASDLNGDSSIDLATANINSDNVSVLLNNGDGSFSPHSVYPVGHWPYSVFAVDLDADGDLDLATPNAGTTDISVLFNDGDGSFTPHSVYPVANFPLAISGGDLDGDGDLDLASANHFTNEVAVLLNNGDGSFAPYSVYQVGDGPYFVFAADLNGDGDLDLATGHGSSVASNTVSVLLNNGDATFADFSTYQVGDSPLSVFAADVDGDGDLDLMVGDADDDSISILLNNGDGSFASDSVFAVGDFPYAVFAADLDGDGDLDIITANRDSDNISVLLNFLRGDANSDGVIDIGDASYVINYLFVGGPAPNPFEAGDVNCDGKVDIGDASYIINYLFIGGPPPLPSC